MKTTLFIAFLSLSGLTLFAQERTQAELKEFFYDAEFFFAQEEYVDAVYDYLELYNNGFSDNGNINYRIGICYLNIPGQKEKSIPYLLEAVKQVSEKYKESTIKQKAAPVDAYLFLGNAYRVNNQLNKAIEAYNKYKEIASTAEELKYADQQIAACNLAITQMGSPKQVKFTNLGDSINGISSNYKGVVSGDGSLLVYMNELPFYDAVYTSTYRDNGWSSPVNITPQIQSDGDQYVTAVSHDGKKMYLTREDAFNSDIYTSTFENDRWTKSLPLAGTEINTKFWESHASVSRDGKTLYFTSNRKGGLGDMDIYVTKMLPTGVWGDPVNLGPVVNTQLNEDTPFITENDSILYFSSQGHQSMGGYDIFVTRLNAVGEWSKPENLGYPVNTTDDDLFYYPWSNGRIGYLSRIETDGKGKEDLYAVQPVGDLPLDELIASVLHPSPIAVPPALTEEKRAAAEEKPVEAPEAAEEKEPAEEPAEEPKVPATVELDPVYFAFDNAQLTEAGKAQLDKLIGLMNDFPIIRVRLVGHADAKGPAEYNLRLSEKRAVSVMQYLTSRGIQASRMETKGLGEKNFAAVNSNPDGTDNPEGRKLNRRVEYEIVGENDKVLIIRATPVPERLKFKE